MGDSMIPQKRGESIPAQEKHGEVNVKIYIATKFEEQNKARKIREQLILMGHEVTSTWLDEPADKDPQLAATDDIRDLYEADAILVVHQSEGGRGMWFEMGYAVAKRKIIFVLGWFKRDRPTIFYNLPEVIHIDYLEQLA